MHRSTLAAMAALVAMMVCTGALAQQTKTISWTAPVEYEDGTPLEPLEPLERYQLACNGELIDYTDPDGAQVVHEWIATPSMTRQETFDAGEYTCQLRVRAIAADHETLLWSAWSNAVFFVVLPEAHPPRAPRIDAVD